MSPPEQTSQRTLTTHFTNDGQSPSMPLIPPKPKNNMVQTSQPIANIKSRARVRVACDRCRKRKAKCDGDKPCLRCTQDEVICTASTKVRADAKAATIEYIRLMETQQSRLIQALKQVIRHVRQPVGEVALKAITEAVKTCGFDFEGIGDQGHTQKPTIKIQLPNKLDNDTCEEIENINSGAKRKRGDDILDFDVAHLEQTAVEIADIVKQGDRDWNGFSKQQRVSELFDDYWNLDAYWDVVAAPYQSLSPAAQPSISFPDQQIYGSPEDLPKGSSQSLPTLPDWMLDGLFQPGLIGTIGPQQDLLGNIAVDTVNAEPPLPTLENFSDRDSTLWYPSLLYDTDLNPFPQG